MSLVLLRLERKWRGVVQGARAMSWGDWEPLRELAALVGALVLAGLLATRYLRALLLARLSGEYASASVSTVPVDLMLSLVILMLFTVLPSAVGVSWVLVLVSLLGEGPVRRVGVGRLQALERYSLF